MKVADIARDYKLYMAKVTVKQQGYSGQVEFTVTAQNLNMAKILMKRQYNLQDHQIGSIREVK